MANSATTIVSPRRRRLPMKSTRRRIMEAQDADVIAHTCVPLRRLTHTWDQRERWRGFVLFVLAAGTWATLQNVRVDAMFAYQTYRVYTLAENEVGQPYSAISTLRPLSDFLENEIVTIMSVMAATGPGAICPECGVGLTPRPDDMFGLSLAHVARSTTQTQH